MKKLIYSHYPAILIQIITSANCGMCREDNKTAVFNPETGMAICGNCLQQGLRIFEEQVIEEQVGGISPKKKETTAPEKEPELEEDMPF